MKVGTEWFKEHNEIVYVGLGIIFCIWTYWGFFILRTDFFFVIPSSITLIGFLYSLLKYFIVKEDIKEYSIVKVLLVDTDKAFRNFDQNFQEVLSKNSEIYVQLLGDKAKSVPEKLIDPFGYRKLLSKMNELQELIYNKFKS